MNYIALFLVLAVYLILPVFLYDKPCKLMGRFCGYMGASPNCRKLFCYMVLIAVIFTHFVYFNVFSNEWGLMISSFILIAMFKTKWVQGFLSMMNESRYYLPGLMCITLITMFIPHLFTLSMTLALLIVAVCFYTDERFADSGVEHIRYMYYGAKQSGDYKNLVHEYFHPSDPAVTGALEFGN